jgi:hypothetical protein
MKRPGYLHKPDADAAERKLAESLERMQPFWDAWNGALWSGQPDLEELGRRRARLRRELDT